MVHTLSWRLAQEKCVMIRVFLSALNVEKRRAICPLTTLLGIDNIGRNQIECANIEVKGARKILDTDSEVANLAVHVRHVIQRPGLPLAHSVNSSRSLCEALVCPNTLLLRFIVQYQLRRDLPSLFLVLLLTIYQVNWKAVWIGNCRHVSASWGVVKPPDLAGTG